MYYVYLLQNVFSKKSYLGYTNNLKRRILEHNTNKSFSTKNKGIWKITYYEAYRRKEDAVIREKRLKNYGQAFSRLKERLIYSLL